MNATVVIVTRNRPGELARAVRSALAQAPPPAEILVYDDASGDAAATAAAARLDPRVRVVRADAPAGYIALRNRGFAEAAHEAVVSLDDDAYFAGCDTLRAALERLGRQPGAAVAALPFVEPRIGRRSERTARPAPEGALLRSFTGCAHVIRRDAARAAGGYRALYVHQGEERDLALRLLDRGLCVVQGGGTPVVHLPSAARDPARTARYGVRNTLLFDFLNLPAGRVAPRLAWDALRLALYAGPRAFAARAGYVAGGLRACAAHRAGRRPVRAAAYRAFLGRPRHAAGLFDGPPPAPAGGGEEGP